MITRRLLAACLLVTAMPVASANELLRVYELALQQDMRLQAARHARDAAIEARPQARAALLPQINASYGYEDSSETGTEGFAGQPEARVDRDSTARALTVRLDQTLFDWAAFKRYDQAGDEAALAQADFRRAEQDLVLRITQAYFGALSAADNLRFSQSEKAAVERQLEQAQRRFDVGLSAITDVQEAQARFDLTVAQEITAEQQLAAAREALREITGAGPNREVPLQEEIPLRLPEPADSERWLDTARDHNLDLVIANLQAEIARTGIDIARAGHLPRVGALAQYQDLQTDGGRFTGESEIETVGVEVSLPIFAGLATRSRVSQARSTHEQFESLFQLTRRGVERSTRDAYLAVNAGAARVRALRQAVLSSTTALEASETGLEVGTRTAVDVLNAQRDLYSAQRDYARARYDYLLSILLLKAAAGTLDVTDLEQIDALLVVGG
ncbi:TolC family outer membrane protein [Panacagrimonas sp.]|uniref:TolC family outer membrane protein n=1 Tax=Panacagrimonas sp. TaxID=2480088 RepID=UPI003B51B309